MPSRHIRAVMITAYPRRNDYCTHQRRLILRHPGGSSLDDGAGVAGAVDGAPTPTETDTRRPVTGQLLFGPRPHHPGGDDSVPRRASPCGGFGCGRSVAVTTRRHANVAKRRPPMASAAVHQPLLFLPLRHSDADAATAVRALWGSATRISARFRSFRSLYPVYSSS